MKNRVKLILDFITLTVTVFLLIFSIYGWFVTNEKASVSGIVASTQSNNLYVSTTYGSGYNTYSAVDDYVSTFTNFDTDYWKKDATISNNNQLLLPTSSYDGETFYYTSEVNSDGTATLSYEKVTITSSEFTTDGSLYIYDNGIYQSVESGEFDSDETYYKYQYNFIDVTSLKSYYYLEEELYICNDSKIDLNCSIRNVTITKGSDNTSNIYKAARVYLESDSINKIFRYSDENNPTAGQAYPANSTTTISSTDPSTEGGVVGNNLVYFSIPGIEEENDVITYSAVKVKLKIWVEGQNINANATYAGSGFRIGLTFVAI